MYMASNLEGRQFKSKSHACVLTWRNRNGASCNADPECRNKGYSASLLC